MGMMKASYLVRLVLKSGNTSLFLKVEKCGRPNVEPNADVLDQVMNPFLVDPLVLRPHFERTY